MLPVHPCSSHAQQSPTRHRPAPALDIVTQVVTVQRFLYKISCAHNYTQTHPRLCARVLYWLGGGVVFFCFFLRWGGSHIIHFTYSVYAVLFLSLCYAWKLNLNKTIHFCLCIYLNFINVIWHKESILPLRYFILTISKCGRTHTHTHTCMHAYTHTHPPPPQTNKKWTTQTHLKQSGFGAVFTHTVAQKMLTE